MKQVRSVIIGASGYTGVELIRLLVSHPHVTIAALVADSNAGQPITNIYPHLEGYGLPDLVKLDQVKWDDVDVAFGCLPHATSQEVIAKLPKHLVVVDLSADFRLRDTAEYSKWYGHTHAAPDLQKQAVYGMTELAREQIKKTNLIANPGCYPTCSILPLYPLLKEKLIDLDNIIIDAKSGVSGAGRSAKVQNLFTEVNEGLKPYGIASHRHTPEIEQALSEAAGQPVQVTFTPQLVPLSRGMLATIYVKGDTAKIKAALTKAYAGSTFVKVTENAPSTRDVAGTNRCHIAVFADRIKGRTIIVSAIDNLVKGASGQAVQNMNVRFGFEETLGLNFLPVFP